MSFEFNKRLVSSVMAIALCVAPAMGQKAIAGRSSMPFEPAEELFYDAEFSKSVLRNLDVAEFKFRTTRTPINSATSESNNLYSLTFSAEVSSKGFFTKLFNLRFRERVESVVEPISFTARKTTILDEQGKRVRQSETIFDPAKGQLFWTQKDPTDPSREPRNVTTQFSGQLQDVLSAIYFIRTQPLSVGKSFEMFIGDSGHVYRVPVQVVERKRMKTIFGKVHVLRVDPDIFGPDSLIEQEKGQLSLWITDDNRRIPVGVKIKSDYGTFDIKLKRHVNNLEAARK
ncbi:MAG TPA: DUF3108 domain-containing protein [Pyrinomonadaceae bacterium]|nr:DUF3108 domain-containing protein [Pyrinomonadaceae bacterium]